MPGVDDAVLDVLGDVVRPHEQQVDRRVRARDEQRALGRLEARGRRPRRGRAPAAAIRPFEGTATSQPAVLAGARRTAPRHLGPASAPRAVEREPVAAGAVPQPLGHARDRRRARLHALGDLEVRRPSLDQARDLPAVRERLELAERAEVAQEALRLVARAKRRAARRRARRGPAIVLDAHARRFGCSRGRAIVRIMLAC